MLQCDTVCYNQLQCNTGKYMTTINARIPEELDKSLASLAHTLDRSKSYIINKALESYIREHLEDLEDAEIALASMNDPNRKLYTSEEVEAKLQERIKNV